MKCTECSMEVERIRREGKGRPVFVDVRGQRWNGFHCPDCKYNKAKKWRVTHDRKCRGCTVPLGLDRFFMCTGCQPVLPHDTVTYVVEHT